MTGHPVLDDPDLSAPLDLIRFDGSRIETRGVLSRLPESAADVRAGFSQRGRQVWVSLAVPLRDHEVEFVRDAAGARFRVLATTNLAGPHRSARLQLQDKPQAAP